MADYIGSKAMLGEMWRRIKDYLTPDYANAYEIGSASSQLMKEGNSYTVPADGWIWYYWQQGGDKKAIMIDGKCFPLSNNDSDSNAHSNMFQVTKGMVISVPTQSDWPDYSDSFNHSETRLYFIPHRNASQEDIYIHMNALLKWKFTKDSINKVEGETWNSSTCTYEPSGEYENYFYGTVTPYLEVYFKNPATRIGQSIKTVVFTINYDQLCFAQHKSQRKKYGRSFTRTYTATVADGSSNINVALNPETGFEFLDWRGHVDWPDSSNTEEWHYNVAGSVSAVVTLENGTTFTLNADSDGHHYTTCTGDVERTFYSSSGIQYDTKVSV